MTLIGRYEIGEVANFITKYPEQLHTKLCDLLRNSFLTHAINNCRIPDILSLSLLLPMTDEDHRTVLVSFLQ
jgi:hypothetical protein